MLTDKNGKNAESLRDKKLYLLDMDGTIYNEDEIFEGTLDFLDEIEMCIRDSITGAVIILAAAGYGAGAYYYKDKFFKGTTINHIACENMTVEQAEDLIRKKVEDYSIRVQFRNDQTREIKGQDISYAYVSDGSVQTVSYTHLDVYKRQLQEIGLLQSGKDILFIKIHLFPILFFYQIGKIIMYNKIEFLFAVHIVKYECFGYTGFFCNDICGCLVIALSLIHI